MSLNLTIKSFEKDAVIPEKYTCNGDNISPYLAWDNVPAEAVTLALLMDDPDAPGGIFTHWIMYNIPVTVTEIPGIIPVQKNLDFGGIHGKNDFGKYGYGGPCPPSGEQHRYFFRLYAVGKKWNQEEGATRQALLNAVENYTEDYSEYTGRYK